MKPQTLLRLAPALLLGAGAALTASLDRQRPMPLVVPLDSAIPVSIGSYRGQTVALSEAEEAVAGTDAYLLRNYTSPNDSAGFSLYIGYYEQQMRGRTIHTPKNCLPGGGWEALGSSEVEVETELGPVLVNRYLLRKGARQAVVLYWYQGRGRVEANEYHVKWDLLRDAALHRRTEEALVRLAVPVRRGGDDDLETARMAAREVVPSLFHALPR